MSEIWAKSKVQVLTEFETNESRGLSQAVVRSRLSRFGPNEIKTKPKLSALKVFWRQFHSPLVAILVIAAGLSLWQAELTDAVVIGAVIIVNVMIGFLEEYRAERAIAKIRQLLAPTARVVRGGEEQKISASSVVTGDIIKLEAGDRIPADARIIYSHNLRVNQAALTGEAMPVHKRETILSASTDLIDRANCVYLGTLVIAGTATAVVSAIGNETEVGKIARQVVEVIKPISEISRKLGKFGRLVAFVSLFFAFIVFLIGILRGVDLATMLRSTLALLVSIVPEGLMIAFTVGLSVGLLRIFKHRAVIRHLQAAETIGSLTTLCIDKTGTLTEGEMMVERILIGGEEFAVTGRGFGLSGNFSKGNEKIDLAKEPLLQLGLELTSMASSSNISRSDLNRDRARELTDPTETALAVVAAKAGYYIFDELKKYPEVLEIPFDQERRISYAVHQINNHNRYLVKGAPEEIIKLSEHRLTSVNQKQHLGRSGQAALLDQAESYARDGYRVVAIAYCDRPKAETPSSKNVGSLVFIALLAINDPIRPEAYKAVAELKKAGIRLIMLTGDHILTATHIAAHVGLDEGRIIHADELDFHDLKDVSVIARLSPSEKLKIVSILQKQGQLVGMTGDGINDAPALKKADVGIAMGRRGTDIAIEASDMVILNDDITTIVTSISQGRLIWKNLKKAIFYLTSTSLGEVLLLVFALALNLPLPIIAIQILWMNFVTDGVTSLSLAFEPPETAEISSRPLDPNKPLIDKAMAWRMLATSLVMSTGALYIYQHFLPSGVEIARTAVLTSLIFYQLLNLLNARSSTRSIFQMSYRGSPVLLLTLFLAVTLQLLFLYVSPFAQLLHLVPLGASELFLCIVVACLVIVLEEGRKLVYYLLNNWAKLQETFVEN